MGLLDKIKQVMWSKTEPVDVDPWVSVPVEAGSVEVQGNPWKEASFKNTPRVPQPVKVDFRYVDPVKPSEEAWTSHTQDIKTRVLRLVAKLLILLNLAVGIFFYSTSWAFNASLWGYLGLVTIILAHYLSVSK